MRRQTVTTFIAGLAILALATAHACAGEAGAPGDSADTGKLLHWPTIIAQVVNFLILVYLLRRFLYGRIVKAMDERQQKIAARLHDAQQKNDEAEQEAQSYQQKTQELDAQREEMLAQAKQEADAHRKELLDKARQEVDASQAKWQQAIARDKAAFLQDLRAQVARQTFAVARRALSDLADADLEERVVDIFVRKLGEMDDAERKAIAEHSEEADDEDRRIAVRSAFGLPEEGRERIEKAIRKHIGKDVEVVFETSPDLVCGIELRAQGRKIAWTAADYLASLEEKLSAELEQAAAQRVSPAPAAAEAGEAEPGAEQPQQAPADTAPAGGAKPETAEAKANEGNKADSNATEEHEAGQQTGQQTGQKTEQDGSGEAEKENEQKPG